MKKSIEDILGVKKADLQREIPGTIFVEGREFWYIEEQGLNEFDALFKKLVRAIDPPLAKSGGVITGGCELTLPDKRRFHAISYKGDLEGWRNQIVEGAKKIGISIAKIEDKMLVVSSGEVVDLGSCISRFY